MEKIRVQEQDKQIAMLKRENEAVKEKLKKSEDTSQTLQNCLKELTDEKHELLDSIEELNEEKAELEEARLDLAWFVYTLGGNFSVFARTWNLGVDVLVLTYDWIYTTL